NMAASSNPSLAASSPPDSLPEKWLPSSSPTPGNSPSPITRPRSPEASPRSASGKREPGGTSRATPRLHHAPPAPKLRRLRESAAAHVRQIPGSSPELATDLARNYRRPSLLQRHHRTAQRRHALALQLGREYLS